METIATTILPLLQQTHKAAQSLRRLSDEQRQQLLHTLSGIIADNKEDIFKENQRDLVRMDDENPKKDRLLLTQDRVNGLIQSLKDVANLPDPTGLVISEKEMKNGLHIQKVSAPLGVVGIIYESRPNVTIDVAALCLRSGNAAVLRGGSDAEFSNQYLVSLIHQAMETCGVDKRAICLLPTDRKFVGELLNAKEYVDILIPRGSQQLIDFVRENASVPTIETGAGVCHTYISASADLAKGAAIVVNAKVSRPSVCNALDTILVDESVAEGFLPMIVDGMKEYDVEIFADETAFEILKKENYPHLQQAEESDFGREYLSYKCSIKILPDADSAFEHIHTYSSKHSEAIISEDAALCERFLNEIDAAAVFTNASTRFTDGGVFGLGAEIGISTQKLHARGPFALEKLVTEKWIVRGNGQIR